MKINQAAIDAREKAGLTVRELAERAGFDYMTLYHFENGDRACRITTVMKFADVLGISLDEYVGRKIPLPDIDKAMKFFKEEIVRFEHAPYINGCEMTEEWKEGISICKTALIALEKYSGEGETNG